MIRHSDCHRPSRSLARLAIAIAVIACTIVGCRAGAADESSDESASAVVGVRTAVATRRPFDETIDALGTVAVRPGHFAELGAPAPTRVARIYVTVGERVAPGAPLVQLDRAPFDAQARSAEVALATAQHAYERARRLVDAGILARKDLDQAASDRARARSDAVAARRAQTLATLRSPIGGVVTELAAVLGGPADPSQPLVEVADPGALDILLAVSPAAAARVHTGAAVTLSAGQRAEQGADSASVSGAGAEALGTGTVEGVGAVVDSASRSVTVRARIAHPARTLRIGESIFGRIVLATRPNAVTVPVEALVPDGEGMKVFVLDSAHIAHATPVSVGARTERLAEITRGLSGGETVVTYGAYGVTDSARVVPLAEQRR
jgi:membrane fusion protein (multidrug efflux system)